MGWRASAVTSGGGELIDTGYHPTYLMLHLAGGTPVEVAALLSTHRLTFAEGEDTAQLLVRFDNGVVGQLSTSWAYDPPPVTERFSAVGPLGSLHSDGLSLMLNRRGAEPQTFGFDPVDSYVAEIGHFADCSDHRHSATAHRGGGDRGARHHPGRLRVGPQPDDREGRRPLRPELVPRKHSCLPPEARGTSTFPERERPWVTRWVPHSLAAKCIAANLTDNVSGTHPTTPRRSLPHRGTFKIERCRRAMPISC